ncbi:MAG: HIT domain-containing protein [Pseudomonadota bacterium]
MSEPTYDPDNIFVKIIEGTIPCHKVYEDDDTLVFMDIMPASRGHCLVVPKAAGRNLFDCPDDALTKAILVMKKVAIAAKKALKADGITLRQNNEAASGQVVFHAHFHIMPRYEGEALIPHNPNQADHAELAQIAAQIAAAIE